MTWTLTLSNEDGSSPDTFTGDTAALAIRKMMKSAVTDWAEDSIDLLSQFLTEVCALLVDVIDGDPQDEYRITGGDMGNRWTIHLKSDPESTQKTWTAFGANWESLSLRQFTGQAESATAFLNALARKGSDYTIIYAIVEGYQQNHLDNETNLEDLKQELESAE